MRGWAECQRSALLPFFPSLGLKQGMDARLPALASTHPISFLPHFSSRISPRVALLSASPPRPVPSQSMVRSLPPRPPSSPHALQASTQKSFLSWTINEVGAWLRAVGLGQYASQFSRLRIDGRSLLALTADELGKDGVGLSAEHQVRFLVYH